MSKTSTLQPLVVTPSPFTNESLLGYVLRVSQTNGYPTPRSFLSYAGLTVAKMTTANFDITKFAQLVQKPLGVLRRYSYVMDLSAKPLRYQLLGQRVLNKDLRLAEPAFCPSCVREAGFIQAHWDIDLVTVCPRHRCSLLAACPSCGQPLSYMRPGLFRCACGADFSDATTASVEGAAVDLSAVLVANILHDTLPETTSGIPAAELHRMSLMTLLRVIKVLSRHYFRSHGLVESNNSERMMETAAQILGQWPVNFFGLLRQIEAQSRNSVASFGLCNRFAGFYDALRLLPDKEIKFLLQAIVEFGLTEWDGGVLHNRLLQHASGDIGRRFISQTELAKRLGTTRKTLRRLEREGIIVVKEAVIGGRRRVLADITQITLPLSDSAPVPGVSFNVDAAARFTGIPRSVLKQLRKSGDFKVNHLAKPYAAYHELDLKGFLNELLKKCPEQAVSASDNRLITLGYILKHVIIGIEEGKADLIRDYLAGRLKAVGRMANAVEAICFKRAEISEYVREKRSEGGTRSRDEAGEMLRCQTATITDLIEKGYLQAVCVAGKIRVTDESIQVFQGQYKTLAEIYRTTGVFSGTLRSACEKLGIPLVWAERPNPRYPQAFIRIEHIGTLLRHFSI